MNNDLSSNESQQCIRKALPDILEASVSAMLSIISFAEGGLIWSTAFGAFTVIFAVYAAGYWRSTDSNEENCGEVKQMSTVKKAVLFAFVIVIIASGISSLMQTWMR